MAEAAQSTTARRVHAGIEGVGEPAAPEPDNALFSDDPDAGQEEAPPEPTGPAPSVTDEPEVPAAPATAPVQPSAVPAAAPAAAGTEPPVTAPAAGTAAPPAEDKTYPWQRLREAERERDQLRQWRAEQERAALDAQTRLQQVQQAVNPQAQQQGWTRESGRLPTPQELDRLRQEDPVEHGSVVGEMALQMAQRNQQEQQLLQTQMQIRADIEEFGRTQADYREAAVYLEARENKRWEALGYSPEQAQQMTQARAGMVVDSALRLGRKVPEAIYALALADGWTAPGPNPAGAVQPAQPVPATQTPQERVQQSVARSRAANGSLGSMPSGSLKQKTEIDHEMAMQLTEEEMERLDREQPGWDSEL